MTDHWQIRHPIIRSARFTGTPKPASARLDSIRRADGHVPAHASGLIIAPAFSPCTRLLTSAVKRTTGRRHDMNDSLITSDPIISAIMKPVASVQPHNATFSSRYARNLLRTPSNYFEKQSLFWILLPQPFGPFLRVTLSTQTRRTKLPKSLQSVTARLNS